MSLVLPTLTKKVNETRTVTFDFTNDLPTGDTLTGSATMVGAGGGSLPSGITVGTPGTPVGNAVTAPISGGTHGQTYEIHCQIGTSKGDVLDLGVVIYVNNEQN